MSLTEIEQDELLELICDIVNSSDPSQEYENPLCHKNLFKQLDRLRLKYGELPDLLSIKADYIDSVDQRVDLYKRAIELAEKLGDQANVIQSTESITKIYIYDQPNYDEAYKWFKVLESLVADYGDEYIVQSLSETKAQVRRLGISCVTLKRLT